MCSLFRFSRARRRWVLLITVLSLVIPVSVTGQATSGLTGVVTDASGAVIVGAEVRLGISTLRFLARQQRIVRANINSCMWLLASTIA